MHSTDAKEHAVHSDTATGAHVPAWLVREALLGILAELAQEGYDFTAPTPSTHARVVARPDRRIGRTVVDLLGWSLPCLPDELSPAIIEPLERAALLERRPDGLVMARVRVSRVFHGLFVHSAYPTDAPDSVFLGPDSHRFADYVLRHCDGVAAPARVLDYGAGAGVGGITAGLHLPDATLTLADVNPKALLYASVNAQFAGIEHGTCLAGTPSEVQGEFDVIVSHPPFMMDRGRRTYRDGGDLYGGRLSVDWTIASLPKLAPGGRFIMHTGVSIVQGRDLVREALRMRMPVQGYAYEYQVLDTDIFGDELEQEAYAEVDRIAAVGICVTRLGGRP